MEVQCAGKGLRKMQLRVLHLDDSVHTFHLSVHATGQELYASMIERIHLLESDYFDLEYVNDEGMRCWLDHDKPVLRQLSPGKDLVFRFAVKFYTPYPNMLEEECTRYLFALQIKRDLVTGTLLCSENTAALLASYIVQAEIGDFIEDEYRTIDYLRPLKLMHEPTEDRLHRTMEYHKAHVGMSPSESDITLLDTARKVEFYGIRLHFARNHEGLGLNLAVSHLGILIFQNLCRISTFSWAKIRKLSFKRKRFLVKLQPERFDAIEFLFDSRDECKQFWKNCIEHHAFFRCPVLERNVPAKQPRNQPRSGSTFRYTGRTQQELFEYVQEHNESKISFERPSAARRAYSSIIGGSSYSSRSLNSASMQLRSSSADRRAGGSNNISVSLTNTLGRSSVKKRSQSEGARTSTMDVEEAPEGTSDGISAVPTSGYATMAESAGSERSAEAGGTGMNQTDEQTKGGTEMEEPELDAITWINETYRRMTGDWTGSATQPVPDETLVANRRSKSTAGSPQTSGTISLSRLDTELDDFLQKHDQELQLQSTTDDEAVTRLIMFGDLADTNLNELQGQNQQQTTPTSAPPTDRIEPTQSSQGNESGQHLSTDLPSTAMFVPDAEIANLVNLFTSPIRHQPSHERVTDSVGSFTLSTTQPDLISQADSLQPNLMQRNENRQRDWNACESGQEPLTTASQSTSYAYGSYRPTYTGSDGISAVSTFVGHTETVQSIPSNAEFLGELGLRTQNALFILPTVTQYGLDINMDIGSAPATSVQMSRAPLGSSAGQPVVAHSVPTIAATFYTPTPHELSGPTTSSPSTGTNVTGVPPTRSLFSFDQRGSTMAASLPHVTYTTDAVTQPDEKRKSLPPSNGDPDSRTYSFDQAESWLTGATRLTRVTSASAYSDPLMSSRSAGQMPVCDSVTTVTYSFGSFAHYVGGPSQSTRTTKEVVQSMPVDQWSSSSGSESTTGVILRPDPTQKSTITTSVTTVTTTTSTKPTSKANPPLSRQHRAGCPHSLASAVTLPEQFTATQISLSSALPALPLNTLPARQSYHKHAQSYSCSHGGSNLSYSIPCGVHLSGLEGSHELFRGGKTKSSGAIPRGEKQSLQSQNPEKVDRATPSDISQPPNCIHSHQPTSAGQLMHPELVMMGGVRAAADMLEEVPYVVLRRPRSVDVKQYQLHLQRQQQQAAALVAAGYSFHPGAPFYGEQAAYPHHHFGHRMPMFAHQFAYQQPFMPPCHEQDRHHRHHHHISSKALDESKYGKVSASSSKQLSSMASVGPAARTDNVFRDPMRPSFREREHSQRDTSYPMESDLYAQPALIPYAEREKCKARRRHPKTPSETKVTKQQQPYSNVTDIKPSMKLGSSGIVSRHHLHCVHRQLEADVGQGNGEHERRQSTSQTRRNLPTKTSTAAKVTDQMRQMPEHARSHRRTPVAESPMNRYKRSSHQEPDDCRESEVPYPVSELFFSPHQAGSARGGHPVKSHGSSRHHQHHPACASLMGRTRPQLVEQESHKSSRAKASSHSVPLPAPSLPAGVDKTRDTVKSRTHTTVETTDRVPSTVQDGGKRTERTPEELTKDTRDTIERLRQELRSAGFQVKDTARSNELPRTPERRDPGVHRALPVSAQAIPTDANKRVHSRSTQRAAIARGDQVSTRDAATVDLTKTEPDKDKVAYIGTSATKETVMETSKMTTNLDMMFGGPPHNPVYLNSDTDSCEGHTGRDGDQAAVLGSEREHKHRETVPVPSEKDYTDPLGLPTTDNNLEQSTDAGKLVAPVESMGLGPPQTAFSPRSHSPSLPLSFPLSDEQYDPTDISLGSQASLLSSAASHKSESYCSECNRKGIYDSSSQTSSHSCCHSRQRRRGHRLDHCHYSRQPHFPSRSSSYCHVCRSPHHHHHHHCYHRHLSDDRRYGRHHSHAHSHRSGRHNSERRRHSIYEKPSSYTHKHGRSISDKRRHQRHMSMSSSDPSEQSWTNSLNGSSVSDSEEESKLLEIGSDGDVLDVKAVLNRIRAQERKLRAELTKHRNLANQLRQAQQRIAKSAVQDQSAEEVVASEKDPSVLNVKSQKHEEKVLQSSKDKKPEGFECIPSSQTGELHKKKSAPCKRQSGKNVKPFSLENVKSAHKSSEKKEENESAKSLHHVTRKLKHYRSHHHAPSIRKSIIPKTGSEMKARVEIDDTVVTHDAADDGDANFDEGGLIIANTGALRDTEPDVDLTDQEAKPKSDQPGLTSKLMLATFEQLEDIAEAAVADEKVELGPNVMLSSTAEPQITCALTTLPAWTQYEVTNEADRVDRTVIISQAPTPPSSPPPSTFLITSTPHDSPARIPLTESVPEPQSTQELDEIEEQQSAHTSNVRWSSTNQLTELGLNEELSDGDSEYDGTRAINMLSEVIENALSLASIQAAPPDLHENSITDGSTQASSVCDDTHTSEASADTVKQAHSPRTISPSCSSSSASEGSEEIEPFPPPPPESLIDVFATHETPLQHSHHLFSTALDEVIEEEGRDMETENASNDILFKAESEDSQLTTEALQTKSIIGDHDKESVSGSAVVEQLTLIEELDISRRSELEPISEGGSVSSEVEQDGESLNLVLAADLSEVRRVQQTDDEESTEVTTEIVQLSDDGFLPGMEESHGEEPAQVQLTETNGVTNPDEAVDEDMPSLDWSQQQDQVDSDMNATHSSEQNE